MLEQTRGWKMMELWILLFLHAQLGGFTPLPPPSSVSISSFNMGHTLSFLPDPLSPAHARFMVQTIRLRRKLWQSVAACSDMADGQTCNLTKVFNDPFESYQARVRAFTSSQTSNWTLSGPFQPITDTVIGPPALSVSGCGNCLVLQFTLPTFGGLQQQQQQLRELYRKLDIQVRRSRDGAQFMMSVPITDQMVIPYLQTGAEYCVSVRVSSLFTTTSHYSQPTCVYTSTPSPGHTAVFVLFGLMGALCSLGLLFIGVVICISGRSFRNPRLLTALVTSCESVKVLLRSVVISMMKTPSQVDPRPRRRTGWWSPR
ncbi:interferon alpha/beta receptor 2-like isoform X2 [Cheilinus undulatus]|uniref:interferon alpha/beta receptor 2-like isoform X2 n=1 Tax=Cheilinus undulatus TaxID=241271 RepID=UPI001BD24D08|nr:interferon alpha/beta receptor 2-like isoform X2 [Cheilinus undulatus]